MNLFASNIVELALFFIVFPFILKLFDAIMFEKVFRKNHVKEIQLIYIFSAIIFSYLFTKAIMNIIYLSTSIINSI
ncbi:MAG: DUF1146 family protein [Candidatus Izimaplasma sp.]|nr:DUF1146 family protein [Candidatus Izimaplasma bacterium]